jgi:hypothetical protein
VNENRVSVLGTLAMLVALAGVAASLTVVFLSMRAVMDIGGVCAEGGPFVPRQPCPDGVPGLLVGGMWIGVLLALVYLGFASRQKVPSLGALLWPALFISLGWNFLDYAFDPPFGGGVEGGWLVPGILFMLMGGIPLVIWLTVMRSKGLTRTAARIPTSFHPVAGIPQRFRPEPDVPSPRAAAAGDLAAALERLDALHKSGALDDSEFKAAKRRAISGGT